MGKHTGLIVLEITFVTCLFKSESNLNSSCCGIYAALLPSCVTVRLAVARGRTRDMRIVIPLVLEVECLCLL